MPIVRITEKEHIDKLMPLIVEMRGEADCTASRIPFNHEAARNYIDFAVTHPDTFGGFLYLEEDGTATGFIGGYVSPVWSNPEALIAYDFGFYTQPHKRGSMAGLRLLRAYEKWAKQVGVSVINIEVRADIDNEAAIKFLEGVGFRCEGTPMYKEL